MGGSYEVFEEGVFGPYDSLLFVCICVREAIDLTGLTTEETVEVWSDLVSAALVESVALSTSRLEQSGTLVLDGGQWVFDAESVRDTYAVSFFEAHCGLAVEM